MNLILTNIRRTLLSLSKKYPLLKKIRPIYILSTFLFLVGIYSMILRMDPVNLTALLNTATVNYKKEKYNRVISILERLFVIHPNHEHIIAHRLLLARSYVMKGDLGDGIKNLEIVVKMNPGVKRIITLDPAFEKLRALESYKALVQ